MFINIVFVVVFGFPCYASTIAQPVPKTAQPAKKVVTY